MDLDWNPADLLQSLEQNNAPSQDYKQKFERQRDANKNLKAMITSIRTSAQDSLAMYNIEKAEKEYLLKQQTALQKELSELKQNYEYMENTNLNKAHLQQQIYNELKKEKVEDYKELGKDYLSLWSKLTCYHNFEVSKPVSKLLSKTEKFIKKHEPHYKKAKIVKTNGNGSSSYDYDTDSQVSTMSQKSSIKRASEKSRNLNSKKRKTDTWDLCSNSTVLSPGIDSYDDIDNLDNETYDSSYSTNVSISSVAACDEPSFNISQFSKKCYCTKKTTSDEKSVQTDYEEYAKLVSVGTNTEAEKNDDPLPSLPFLLDDDLLNDFAYSDTPAASPLEDDLVLEQALEYINTNPMKDIKNTIDAFTNTEVAYPVVQKLPLLDDPSVFDPPKLGKSRSDININRKLIKVQLLGITIATQTLVESSVVTVIDKVLPNYSVAGTNTEEPMSVEAKETCVMVCQATSTDEVIIETSAKHTSTDSTVMSDASTITTHSSTTRGTSTATIAVKSIAIQFPEINSCSVDSILSEMKFVMPICISPIPDLSVQQFISTECQTMPECKIISKSFGTLTEINNVCRKVDYVITKDETRRIKKEVLSPAVSMGNLNMEQCPENRSFMVLGQTLFEIFLERLQMTRNHFMNEEISLQNWNEMKEKVMDEFLALTNEKDFPDIGDCDNYVEKSKENRRLEDLVSNQESMMIDTPMEDAVIVSSTIESKNTNKGLLQITNRISCVLDTAILEPILEIPEISLSQELPEVSEEMPEASQKMPEVIQELPEVIQELQEVIQELPEVIQELPEVIQELPEVIQELPEVIKELPEVIQELPKELIEISPHVSKELCLESHNVPKDSQELQREVSLEPLQILVIDKSKEVSKEILVECLEDCSEESNRTLLEGSTNEMPDGVVEELQENMVQEISELKNDSLTGCTVELTSDENQEVTESVPMEVSIELPQETVEDLHKEPLISLSEDPLISLPEEPPAVLPEEIAQIELITSKKDVAQTDIITPSIVSTSNEIPIPQSTEPTFKLPLTPKTSPITNSKQRKREKKSLQKMFDNIKNLVNIPQIIEPIEELPDVIWSCLFPKSDTCEMFDESPRSPVNILEDFDFDYETIEVPIERLNQSIKEVKCEEDEDMEVEQILEKEVKFYSDNETPQSPPPFIQKGVNPSFEPPNIPLEQEFSRTKLQSSMVEAVLEFNPQLRSQFFQNQKELNITDKCNEKRLCKIRKSLKIYLEAPWTTESLEECLLTVGDYTEMEELLTEAIWETVDDQKDYPEVNADFTTPAPALPQYLQRIILLISKLTEMNWNLPKKLLADLEEKVFKLDNAKMEVRELTNITYYYSALMDLFFDGDGSMIFHYIVKSLYYYGYKAIPMTHVLIKAFPSVLPKKSLILKKYLRDVDWENVSPIEVSKMELDLEQVDSLDITVMHMLTNIKMYNIKKHPSYEIRDHELFKYLPKYYGFSLNFITAPKLLEFLMKRLKNNQLQNLSFSFILLARRMNSQFALNTMLKTQLIPLLREYFEKYLVTKAHEEEINLLIETISVILKPHSDEKDKSFVDIFSMIINILSRSGNHSIEESCIKALLRLQRLNSNPKDIYKIIKQWNPLQKISQSLQLMIRTFVHRKNGNFFQS
ncbi:unnamed protein product [Diamesa hyperborea]